MIELVVPAFNEADRLPPTLRSLRAFLQQHPLPGHVEIVVVDNCSTDGTTEVAEQASSPELPVRSVQCDIPGKGAAVAAGVAATTAPIVGFMDADGATSYDALADALRHLALGADVAIGSRGLPESVTMVRTSWARARGAETYRRLVRRIVPGITDTQCGFKLLQGDLARRVFPRMRTTGFSFDVELLARLRCAGARIVEFPVEWIDVPGSTFVPARHGAGAFVDLAVIAWHLGDARRLPAPLELPPASTPTSAENLMAMSPPVSA